MRQSILTSFRSSALNARRQTRQRGFLMLEVTLALLLAGVAAGLGIQASLRAQDLASAQSQADALGFVRNAAETLVQEKYLDYQAGNPISRNGVTLASGTSSGQSLQPTIVQLKAMSLGIDQAAEQGFFKSLANATYQINIQRLPVGCAAAPNPVSGVLCQISGTVCFTAPVRPFGAPANETDGFAIGGMLSRLGGNGGASIEGVEANITGVGGSWSVPNPIAGTPAGIVCARFGFGSSGLASFLRLNDTRDPGFQGGVTVDGLTSTGVTLQVNGSSTIAGSINVGGATTVGGTSTFNGPANFNAPIVVTNAGGTACVSILRQGQIDINCNGVLNAKAGTFAGPLGTVRVGDTGTAYTVDSTGSVRAQTGFYTAVGSVFGDNTLGIRAASTVFTVQTSLGVDAVAIHDDGRLGARQSLASQALGLSNPVVAGQACANPATEVPATLVTAAASTVLRAMTGGGVASCIGGRWTAIAQTATPGSACSPDGAQAISMVDGRGLVCRNSFYMQINDLLSNLVWMNSYRVTDGDIVVKPTCGQLGSSVGVALATLTGQVESSRNASFSRRTNDVGPNWEIVLQDSDVRTLGGAPLVDALLQVYCYY